MAKEKISDETLLSMLQALEDDSSHYTFGDLQDARREAAKEYYQQPYGNEEDGWSQVVTSDVADTVEWLLPDLLDMFVQSEDAVVFDPTREDEAEQAEQATDTCNYVFYKQNDGFLTLYTAFKDALMFRSGITTWRKQTKRERETVRYDGITYLELAAKQQPDDEIESAEVLPPQAMSGVGGLAMVNEFGQPLQAPPRLNVRLSRVVERKTIKVEAIPPEHLLVQRDWTSPILTDCPYVCRFMEVTLSDLNELAEQMGFDEVTAEELKGSDQSNEAESASERLDRTGGSIGDDRRARDGVDTDDPSLTTGWLRIEWVLADCDGDGIAERREIWRLDDKILSNKECRQVPVAVGSPILVQHQWDGRSVHDLVRDLQRTRTDLLRAALNNASLAANPRKTVLTSIDGAPYANIDDLIDYRPGGVSRVYRADALGVDSVPFVAGQVFPVMEYVDGMREQRTGVTKQRMGMQDANALQADRTLGETRLTDAANRQRVKLIARILAETIVKPTFNGILKLLTEGDMEPLAFRLRGKFVQYNPNDWRDSYDMTINVGLGTGDREQKIAVLTRVKAEQMAIAQSPLGPMMVTPQQIYASTAAMLDLSGFKNVDKFWKDPGDAKLPEKPPEPPPWQLQAKQLELQADQMKFQAESQQSYAQAKLDDQRKQRELEAQNELQRQNDERDFQREREAAAAETARQLAKDQTDADLKASELALQRYNADRDRANALLLAKMANPDAALPQGWGIDPQTGELLERDPLEGVTAALQTLIAQTDADRAERTAPKIVVRDESGVIAGYTQNGVFRPLVRDESGRVVGV